MDCKEQSVPDLIGLSNRRYLIPIYQRKYSWGSSQWQQLFNDILALDKRKKHFLGPVVLTSPENLPGNISHQYIIDGQQRMITMSILYKALHDVALSHPVMQDLHFCSRLMESVLVHRYDDTDNRFRVQPNRENFTEYKTLFSGEKIKPNSLITKCYLYFYARFEKEFIDKGKHLSEFLDRLYYLNFLTIELHHDDDAQVIFESINATGLALTEGDKIRNYILMGCSPEVQKEFYNQYWEKIEANTGDNINYFLRYYLMAQKLSAPRLKTLYQDFKGFWEEQKDKREILKQILTYSKIYRELTTPEDVPYDPNDEFSKVLFRLVSGDILRMTGPFLLPAIDYCRTKGREQDILEILKILESFLVRRIICRYNKNSYTTIFQPLHFEVESLMRQGNHTYPEALTIRLMQKKRRQKFPDNQELLDNFITMQFYGTLLKEEQAYLLARLETGNMKEGESHRDVLEKLNDGAYTIEHIMPRKLTPEWEEALGKDAAEIHENYLHTIGNITITAYNSSLSNRSFKDKKSMKNGFDDSPLRLNEYLKTIDHWNKKTIEKRATLLYKKAIELWPYFEVPNQLTQANIEQRPLNLYDDFTFTELKSFQYKNIISKHTSWTEAMPKLLEIMQKENPDNIILTDNDPKEWQGNPRISKSDTNTKIKLIKELFQQCGLKESDLIFNVEVKEPNDPNENLEDYAPSSEDLESSEVHEELPDYNS